MSENNPSVYSGLRERLEALKVDRSEGYVAAIEDVLELIDAGDEEDLDDYEETEAIDKALEEQKEELITAALALLQEPRVGTTVKGGGLRHRGEGGVRIVCHYSGGVCSFLAAKRAVEKYGAENVTLLFCDTGEESEGLWRFLVEGAAHLRARLVVVRKPGGMDALIDEENAIPNNRMAFCTRKLKREVGDRWCAENAPDALHVFGIEPCEMDRAVNLTVRIGKDRVWFPMLDRPLLYLKAQMIEAARECGLTISDAYLDGASHDNCDGGCVKQGLAGWAWTYHNRPATWRRWKERQDRVSARRGYTCTILRDRRGGETKPLTFDEFEARLLADPMFGFDDDSAGCGCYLSTAADPNVEKGEEA